MSDISKENYEDFLNFEKLWDEWRLKEEVSLETFVGSGYYCVEEFYNFSKKYFREKLEQENKMMRECLEIIKEDKYEATPWLTVETGSAKRAKECLAKLTEDEE